MTDQRDYGGEGEQRKRKALDLLAVQREILVRRGRCCLLARVLDAGKAMANDLRAVVQLPPVVKPIAFGAVPGSLNEARIIFHAGYGKTTRTGAHARPVQLWALADRAGVPRR